MFQKQTYLVWEIVFFSDLPKDAIYPINVPMNWIYEVGKDRGCMKHFCVYPENPEDTSCVRAMMTCSGGRGPPDGPLSLGAHGGAAENFPG